MYIDNLQLQIEILVLSNFSNVYFHIAVIVSERTGRNYGSGKTFR